MKYITLYWHPVWPLRPYPSIHKQVLETGNCVTPVGCTVRLRLHGPSTLRVSGATEVGRSLWRNFPFDLGFWG